MLIFFILFLSCFCVVQRQVRNERQRETKRERPISAPSDTKAPDSTSETVNSPDTALVYGILKIKKRSTETAEKSKREGNISGQQMRKGHPLRKVPVSLPQWNTFKRALFGIFPRCGGSP